MTIESVTYISDLNPAYPGASDLKSEGDDHIRNLKTALKTTFPNVAGIVTPTHVQLNYVTGVTSGIQAQLDSKAGTGAVAGYAPLAGATFSGNVSAPNYGITGTSATIGYVGAAGSGIELYGSTSGTPNILNLRTSSTNRLTINAAGAVSIPGAVTVGSLSGALSGNISQFTNDAGYLTGTGTVAASSLTGTSLAANVVNSSLQTVGTLSALTVSAPITGSVTGSAGSVAWTSITGKPTVFSTVATNTTFTGSDAGTGSYLTDVTLTAVGSAITLNVSRTYHTGGGGGGP